VTLSLSSSAPPFQRFTLQSFLAFPPRASSMALRRLQSLGGHGILSFPNSLLLQRRDAAVGGRYEDSLVLYDGILAQVSRAFAPQNHPSPFLPHLPSISPPPRIVTMTPSSSSSTLQVSQRLSRMANDPPPLRFITLFLSPYTSSSSSSPSPFPDSYPYFLASAIALKNARPTWHRMSREPQPPNPNTQQPQAPKP